MQGMMMHMPLRIIEILDYAAQAHPGGEIVSVRTEGDIHRETYAEAYARAGQLAHGLAGLGVGQGVKRMLNALTGGFFVAIGAKLATQ